MNAHAAASATDTQPADGVATRRGGASSRLFSALLSTISAAFGAASATAATILSGALDAAEPTPTWPASALLVGLVGAIWFGGVVRAAALVATGAQPTRTQGWLAAFGLAPFSVALFFFVVGVGVTGGVPGGYVAVGIILVAAVLARRLLSTVSEKLLICFFLWLGLLVMPVMWSDPVDRLFSGFLLALLRSSGVIV
ncbi:MAG: hypothetical protein KF849_15750 [Rhizobiaceae bacterium]|nr:hypothetical protein [Rhizobiaceae bacterium]